MLLAEPPRALVRSHPIRRPVEKTLDEKLWDEMTDFDKHVLLARHADRLEGLAVGALNMCKWSSCDATECSCGTVGCNAGWVATWNAHHGWRFDDLGETRPNFIPLFRKKIDPVYSFAEFFAIPEGAASRLCRPVTQLGLMTYRTATKEGPADVARRIRVELHLIDPAALAAA